MNNLENFNIQEGAEGVDNGAFERLREKMAQARAQIKRDQKQEASQVKKDDILFNVLIEFIKHFPSDHPIVKGIVSCLAANIPSLVILASISLNYKSINKAIQSHASQYQSSESLSLPTSDDLKQFNQLIEWLKNLQIILANTKQSDQRHIFHNQKLNPSLQGLITHTLTEFFNNNQSESLNNQNIQDYTTSILENLNSNLIQITQKEDDSKQN